MTHHSSIEPEIYELIIAGRLDSRRAAWFEGLALGQQEDGNTRLTGPVADQAALYALISRIRDLGLKLISVNRIQ